MRLHGIFEGCIAWRGVCEQVFLTETSDHKSLACGLKVDCGSTCMFGGTFRPDAVHGRTSRVTGHER